MKFKDILLLLRFPFSVFLLPFFLFALSQSAAADACRAWILFGILHLLVYPASNGYNSFQDQDKGSIGGLKHPPKAGKELLAVTLVMDLAALLLGIIFLGLDIALLLLIYIGSSRAYSFRGIRLKKYPFAGWFTVIFFQGAFTYGLCLVAINGWANTDLAAHGYALLFTSLLLGGVYPLTQVYQHRQDLEDGVTTISYRLGYRGTFVFTIGCFLAATFSLYLYFLGKGDLRSFWIVQTGLAPSLVFFAWWMTAVFRDEKNADYTHSLRMNVLSSLCLNTSFGALAFFNFYQ